jgi:hypothetical protein
MDNQRLILFVVLGLLFLMLWQSWVEYNSPEQPVQISRDNVTTDMVDKGVIPETPSISSDTPALSRETLSPALKKAPEGEAVMVETDFCRY